MAKAVTAARKGVPVYRRITQARRADELRRERFQMTQARRGRTLEIIRMEALLRHQAETERQGRERIGLTRLGIQKRDELARQAAGQKAQAQAFDQTMEQIKLLPNEHDRLAAAVQLNVKAGRQTPEWGTEAMKLIDKDRKFVEKEGQDKRRSALMTRFTAADPREKQAVISEGIVGGLLDPKMAQEWRAIAARGEQQEREPTVAQVRTARMDELKRTGDMLKVWFRRTITNASPKKTRGTGLTTGLLNDLTAGAMVAAQQQHGDRATPAQIMATAQGFLRQNWDWIYVQANTTKTPYGAVKVPRGEVPELPRPQRAPGGPGRAVADGPGAPGAGGYPAAPWSPRGELDPNDPLGLFAE